MATQAAKNSARPCRIALLVQDSTQIQDLVRSPTPGVRKHILSTISAFTASIFSLEDANFPRLTESRPLHASPVTVLLIVIENTTAPGYDLRHVHAALAGEQGVVIHPLPHRYASQPPDTMSPCPARDMQDRHHPLHRSSQTWCRAAQYYAPPPHACDSREPEEGRIPHRRSAGDRLHPLLGLLGVKPKGLKADIASHSGVIPTPPETIKQISSLVLNTSVTIYRRSEAFRRWRRKT